MGDDNLNPAWMAQLPDNLKSNEAFTGFKTVGDFAQAHLDTLGKSKELEGKMANAVFVPGDGAKEEDWAAFYGRLGRPEKADDYALTDIQIPEGLVGQDAAEALKKRGAEDLSWFRSTAHNLGLSASQAEKLFAEYNKRNGEYYAQLQIQRERAMKDVLDKLQADPEWAGEKTKENIAMLERVVEKFNAPGLKPFLDATGLGNNVSLIMFLYNVAKAMGEDKYVAGGPGGGKKDGWSYPSMKD